MARDDGGPEYPGGKPLSEGDHYDDSDEVSLRDYFAGHAVTGILAMMSHPQHEGVWHPKDVAESAFEVADAMMEVAMADAMLSARGGTDG